MRKLTNFPSSTDYYYLIVLLILITFYDNSGALVPMSFEKKIIIFKTVSSTNPHGKKTKSHYSPTDAKAPMFCQLSSWSTARKRKSTAIAAPICLVPLWVMDQGWFWNSRGSTRHVFHGAFKPLIVLRKVSVQFYGTFEITYIKVYSIIQRVFTKFHSNWWFLNISI